MAFIYLAGSLTASLSLEELLGFIFSYGVIGLVFLLVFYILALLGKARRQGIESNQLIEVPVPLYMKPWSTLTRWEGAWQGIKKKKQVISRVDLAAELALSFAESIEE